MTDQAQAERCPRCGRKKDSLWAVVARCSHDFHNPDPASERCPRCKGSLTENGLCLRCVGRELSRDAERRDFQAVEEDPDHATGLRNPDPAPYTDESDPMVGDLGTAPTPTEGPWTLMGGRDDLTYRYALILDGRTLEQGERIKVVPLSALEAEQKHRAEAEMALGLAERRLAEIEAERDQ